MTAPAPPRTVAPALRATLGRARGAIICVPPGSTTEVLLAEWFRANRLTFQPVLIEDLNEIHAAFLAGRCDAFTRDMTGLSGLRMSQPDPEAFVLLSDSVTMEPLGALVRKGDGRWFDVVRWTQFALVWAEQQSVTAATADAPAARASSDVRRLLGADGDSGPNLGLDRRWAAKAIKAVGNHGAVWQRNVAPFGLERGLNRTPEPRLADILAAAPLGAHRDDCLGSKMSNEAPPHWHEATSPRQAALNAPAARGMTVRGT